MNYDKTSIISELGSLKGSNAQLYTQHQINWTNEPINILGVWIDHSEERMMQLNLDEIITKSKSIIGKWVNRNLSLAGKVQVLNSLVSSLYVYRLTVLPLMGR